MMTKAGCHIIRFADLSWSYPNAQHPNSEKEKIYWHDDQNHLTLKYVECSKPVAENSTQGSGLYAHTLLEGSATSHNNTVLSAMDVLLSGQIPSYSLQQSTHAHFFSCHQNDATLHAIQTQVLASSTAAWDPKAGGLLHMKPLINKQAGRLMLTAMRLSAGFTVPVGSRPHIQAALVLEGYAQLESEKLMPKDFMVMDSGVAHGPIQFPEGATLLMLAMNPA